MTTAPGDRISADPAYSASLLAEMARRGSFGYPACPDVAEQVKMVPLPKPATIDVQLSEEFQWHPEQSTAAVVTHHSEATYFAAR